MLSIFCSATNNCNSFFAIEVGVCVRLTVELQARDVCGVRIAFEHLLQCFTADLGAREGVAEGWLCNREQGGVRFSRPVKPSPATHGYSVDAVVMDRVAGPKHTHTNGEVNLCFTEDGAAEFCGHPEGWVVFPPGSTHVPRVDGGRMLILYFLPGGAIQFL